LSWVADLTLPNTYVTITKHKL